MHTKVQTSHTALIHFMECQNVGVCFGESIESISARERGPDSNRDTLSQRHVSHMCRLKDFIGSRLLGVKGSLLKIPLGRAG